MGLVQNLKKTLSNLVDKILVDLSYHYIKQRAKQTSKRLEDSLPTMSSPNPLTTENPPTTIATSSTDTSEKIIMETQIDPVNHVRDWAMDKIELLHEADRHRNAKALLAEFDEWINLPEGEDEITYLCLEDEDWTDDQEVDVR
jgi:hypothetical protein